MGTTLGTATYSYDTTAGDNALDDVANGLAYLVIPATATALMVAGKYYYAFKRLDASSPVKGLTLFPPISDYKDRMTVVAQGSHC